MNKRLDTDSWIAISFFLLCSTMLAIVVFGAEKTDFKHSIPFFCFFILYALLLPFSIKNIIRLYKLPKCKAAEIVGDNFIIYGYRSTVNSYVKYKININDIDEYHIGHVGQRKTKYYSYMDIFTTSGHYVIKELDRRTKNTSNSINYNVFKIKRLLNKVLKEHGIMQSKLPNKSQNKFAKAMFENYLTGILGVRPLAVRYIVHWFKFDNKRFYILKFKRNNKDKKCLLGVNGGYHDSKTRSDGFSLTEFNLYNKKTAIRDAKNMVTKFSNNPTSYPEQKNKCIH